MVYHTRLESLEVNKCLPLDSKQQLALIQDHDSARGVHVNTEAVAPKSFGQASSSVTTWPMNRARMNDYKR